jgi:hypothetical protein
VPFPVDAQFDRGLGPGGMVLAVDRADADVVGRADENWASRAVIGRDGGAVVGRGSEGTEPWSCRGSRLEWLMASLQTLERRIAALEARLADVEGGYGDTLYKLHRASVKADLRTARILERLEIEDVADEDVDQALDEQ